MNDVEDDGQEYPYVDEDGRVWFNEDSIVEQFVDVRWAGRNKAHLISVGYIFTKIKDIIRIDVRHLTKASHYKVTALCPICGYRRGVWFQSITRQNHSKCTSCTNSVNLTSQVFGRLVAIEREDKPGRASWKCECECGEICYVSARSLQTGVTKSCGCLGIEARYNRCGVNSPHWNSNLTEEDRIRVRKREVRVWAKDVKTRDIFTCQCCGKVGGRLVSHHLNGYKDFPEQRSELTNGTTLCENCHKEFHSWMGSVRVSCNRDDFVKYCQENYPNALFLTNGEII